MKTAFDNRQTATILAALRYYQNSPALGESSGASDIADIATDGGTIDPMGRDEIDDLCEQVNVVPQQFLIVVGCEGGLVQGASSNIAGLSMIVLDYDTEGAGDDEITEVPQSDTVELEPAIVGLHSVAHDAPWIQQICNAVGVKGLRQQINIQTSDSSELLEWCKQLREEIGGMGFDDPDQAVDGSDAVEYLGRLYDDLGRMVTA